MASSKNEMAAAANKEANVFFRPIISIAKIAKINPEITKHFRVKYIHTNRQ